jgi:hypothetical protein
MSSLPDVSANSAAAASAATLSPVPSTPTTNVLAIRVPPFLTCVATGDPALPHL